MTTPSTTLAARPLGMAPLPTPLRLGLARTRVEVKAFFREKDAVIFVFAFPVIMLAIFATVFGGEDGAVLGDGGDPGMPFAQYFLPGMLAAGIMLSSFQSLAISIAIERDDGTLKRLRGTPMPPSRTSSGKMGQVLRRPASRRRAPARLRRRGLRRGAAHRRVTMADVRWMFGTRDRRRNSSRRSRSRRCRAPAAAPLRWSPRS